MKVVAYTKYGREAASTRQRLLQYLPAFASAGIDVEWHPLLGDDYVRSLAHGRAASKAGITQAYARRFARLLDGSRADLVWVYAELFPYLPAVFERLAFRSGAPVVYDCDDAFFIPYDQNRRALFRTLLGGKLEPLLKGAAACTCGNAYLSDYAARFCDRTMVVPTVVDTDRYRPRAERPDCPLTIGWIGSPTTWPNVRPLLPLLEDLCARHDLRFRVVGAGRAAENDRFQRMELIDWTEAGEITEVQGMDIGIMPLTDTPFERGKSGYKLIQYMACGLPVIASPVGVNRDIVAPSANGFLAATASEWQQALAQLVADPALRRSLGQEGRRRAIKHYSLSTQAPRLVTLFRDLADPR